MNSDCRIVATVYSQGTWFVSGVSVNPLNKGDDDDDDDN